MRRASVSFVVGLVLIACGGPAVPPPIQTHSSVPRLAPPPLVDPDVRGSAYLTAVALALQPAWHQFLEDCRLRLPADHALNEMSLVAIAELEVDPRGQVRHVEVATSGNADFDRAVRHVIADASPLPPPPRELWSDDDHVHLAWTFARDRRQAGPATAQIVDVELPLRAVVERRIGERDMTRAARRILRAPVGRDRDLAVERLMLAALHDSLDSSDGAVRRAAIDAIGRARVVALARDVRQLLAATSDGELRLAAIEAAIRLRDDQAADVLLEQLPADVREQPRLALAAVRALVALGRAHRVTPVLAELLDPRAPDPTALQALASAPIGALANRLPAWFRSANARQRAAVCTALAGYSADVAWPLLARGLADRDATVRASCVAAMRAAGDATVPASRAVQTAQRTALRRLRDLARDRDSTVRAHAIATLAVLAPSQLPDASDDRAADVRAAYASALATTQVRTASAQLHALIEDRDPDVRAAAWRGLAALAGTRDAELRRLAGRGATDAAPQVRSAVIPVLDDSTVLGLATGDAAAEVRTEALVALAGRRGRAASTNLLVERFAAAPPGSAERVRTALAWLLAR